MKKKKRDKEKVDGLESKVLKLRPFKDKGGRYIPYCDFGYHQGIVLRPNVCEERKCYHYHKFYINNETQLNNRRLNK